MRVRRIAIAVIKFVWRSKVGLIPLLLWLACFDGTWQGTFTAPETADSSACGARDARETGPLTPLIRLYRCDGKDTTFALPSVSPGDSVPFQVTGEDGHVYFVEARIRDAAGNVSCGYQSICFPFPAIEEPPPPPPADTSGTGITGQYFNGRSRSTWIATRRDTTVNFNWGAGSPMPGVNVDEFSAEWIGKLIVPAAGAWTLYLEVDDGGQLYEGVPSASNIRIDRMGAQPLTEWSWSGNLIAGEHGLAIVFQATTGNAQIKFSWSGPGIPKQVVPRSALR